MAYTSKEVESGARILKTSLTERQRWLQKKKEENEIK